MTGTDDLTIDIDGLTRFLAGAVARVEWVRGGLCHAMLVRRPSPARRPRRRGEDERTVRFHGGTFRRGDVASLSCGLSRDSFDADADVRRDELVATGFVPRGPSVGELLCTAGSNVALELARGYLASLGDPVPSDLGEGGVLVRTRLRDVRRAVARVMAPASGPLLDLLGADLVGFLSRHAVDGPMLGHVAWPGDVGLRRRQALDLHPAFAPWIMRSPEVARAVDAGRPFEPLLAGRLVVGAGVVAIDVPMAVTRRLRTLPGVGTELRHLVGVAVRLPADALPRDDAGWDALGALAWTVHALSCQFGLDVRTLLAPVGGDWVGFQASLGRRFGGEAGLTPEWRMHYLRHTVDHLVDTVVRPLAVQAGADPDAVDSSHKPLAARMLFGGLGLMGVFGAHERASKSATAIETAVPHDDGMREWPAPFPEQVMGDGLVVVPLTSELQLAQEGLDGPDPDGVPGLAHCVVTYAPLCLAGGSHVLSVRRRVGRAVERLATAHFEVSDAGMTLTEVRGRANSEPADVAVRACIDVQARIAAGTLALAPEARARVSTDLAEAFGRERSLRYDPWDEAKLSLALDAWRHHLVPTYAGMTLAELRASGAMAPPTGGPASGPPAR